MKIKNIGAFALSVLSISGCVETSGVQESKSPATFEMEAAPTDVTAKVKQYLNSTLKDPGSLQNFQVTKGPEVGVLNYGAFARGPRGKTFGNELWYVCAQFNARNSFGGYVGIQKRPFFFYQNKVVRMYDGESPVEYVSKFKC